MITTGDYVKRLLLNNEILYYSGGWNAQLVCSYSDNTYKVVKVLNSKMVQLVNINTGNTRTAVVKRLRKVEVEELI